MTPGPRLATILAAAVVVVFALAGCRSGATSRYFAIEVVDADTGRGIPLVELKTTNEIRLYTDSNGLVAFDEPGLMGGKVYFGVESPGYETRADGFGSRGAVLTATPGKSVRLALTRLNIAERLYRITGQGIYTDTLRLGRTPPIKEPLISGRVMGQDSVLAVPYRGKVYWFWGDTSRPEYPLGNYGTSGATSPLNPDPERGIDLTYFIDPKTGFSRPMVPLGKPGLVWIEGVTVVRDDATSAERMLATFTRLKDLGTVYERGLIEFDDATQKFKPVPGGSIDLSSHLYPRGQALHVTVAGTRYMYFAYPFPLVRVRADWSHASHLAEYESFTCLKHGARYDKDNPALDRDADGKLIYAWKRGTDPVGPAEQEQLIKSGKIKREEAWLQLRDAETNELVTAHAGSVAWNAFRNRYVMIFTQAGGEKSTGLGEVWYAEADAPEGPWKLACKVATHPNYSFYNPCHHAFLDRDNGRFIYFEGTYTAMFSAARFPTPRYDYNQIMYRLDLSDPRLKMP